MTSSDGIVYVVDEDSAVREALSRLVASASLEPRPCNSMREFLDDVPDSRAVCALVDVSNPRLRDASLRLALRARAAVLPVIALSSSDDASTRRRASEAGVQAYFSKPVDGAALLDSISWIGRHDSF